MQKRVLIFFLFVTSTARADVIGMIKPIIVAEKKENGKVIEMKVEYEAWNYWHSQLSHKWTEVYRFNQSGVVILTYGDGNFAGPAKTYWKRKYEVLDEKRLKVYYYEYGDTTTTYPESQNFLTLTDTVEITNKFSKLTLDKIKSNISEHIKAFESRDKSFRGKNKAVQRTFERVVDELLNKPDKNVQLESKRSYTWLYIVSGTLIVSFFAFWSLKKQQKNYRS